MIKQDGPEFPCNGSTTHPAKVWWRGAPHRSFCVSKDFFFLYREVAFSSGFRYQILVKCWKKGVGTE